MIPLIEHLSWITRKSGLVVVHITIVRHRRSERQAGDIFKRERMAFNSKAKCDING
jgi:hypothetical protein